MKCLLVILLLIQSLVTAAQPGNTRKINSLQVFGAGESIHVIYHPVYNGVQMVEVDVNANLRAQHELKYATRSLYLPYINILNPLYLRNSKGEIIEAYNDDKRAFLKEIKLTVEQSSKQAKPHSPSAESRRMYQQEVPKGYLDAEMVEWYYTVELSKSIDQSAIEPYTKPVEHIYVVSRNGRYGVIDSLGKLLIPLQYDKLYAFKYGYYVATRQKEQPPGGNTVYKWGFITKELQQVLPVEYEEIGLVNGKHFVVKKNGLSGILLADGQELVPLEFTDIHPEPFFYLYQATYPYDTTSRGGKIRRAGIITKEGEIRRNHEYLEIEPYNYYREKNQHYLAYTEKGILILDQYGNKVCDQYFTDKPLQEKDKQWTGYINDSLALGGKRKVTLDSNYKEIRTNTYYHESGMQYGRQLIGVLKEENGRRMVKYGVMEKNRLVLDTVYERIHEFSNYPLYFVKTEGRTDVYDHDGKLALEQRYLFFQPLLNGTLQGVAGYTEETVNGKTARKPILECFSWLFSAKKLVPVPCR